MSENTVMDLSILQLSIAYVFVLILLIIFKSRGIRREKEILIATTRMTVQLTVMGLILMVVFRHAHWWLTVLMVAIMIGFAIYNAIKRVKIPMSGALKRLIAVSMIFGALMTAAFFIIVVLQVRPWFNPQYFIPISGMVVGNCMTGIALGANKLCGDMADKREMIENSLMLGATPFAATKQIVNDAFDSCHSPHYEQHADHGNRLPAGDDDGADSVGHLSPHRHKVPNRHHACDSRGHRFGDGAFRFPGVQNLFSKDARLLPMEKETEKEGKTIFAQKGTR